MVDAVASYHATKESQDDWVRQTELTEFYNISVMFYFLPD